MSVRNEGAEGICGRWKDGKVKGNIEARLPTAFGVDVPLPDSDCGGLPDMPHDVNDEIVAGNVENL